MMRGGARFAALAAACMLAGAGPTAFAEKAKSAQSGKPRTARSGNEGELPTPLPLEEETEHVVIPGETLGGIANRAKVPKILIIEANHLKPPHYAIRTGQKLHLPRTRHHIVKAGESGFDIAMRYGVSYSSIAVANGLEPNEKLRTGQKLLIPTLLKPPSEAEVKAAKAATDDAKGSAKPTEKADAKPRFLWPMEGRLRRGFVAKTRDGDGGDFHNGLDLVAPEGETVRTAAPGEVIFAAREPDSFGNLVVVDHGNGWQTAYGFLSKLTVKRGDKVKAHDRVGLVGHSGRATRDELHFEIRRNDIPVDPTPLLPRREGAKADKKDAERIVNGPIEGRQNTAQTSATKPSPEKQTSGKKPGKDESQTKSKSVKAPAQY